MSDDEPKSALELAMERLARKDAEGGTKEASLTDEQRRELAAIRKVYEARLAETEILHRSQLAGTADPEAREALETNYRRDRDRLASDRDGKLKAAREGFK